MPVKILTVHYDPARGIFEDEVIAEFIQNKRIIEMTPQFFMLNGKPHWTLYINYEIDLPDVVRNTDGLSHDEQLLLKRLTEWRTETAEEIKMPPFIIASNKQLVSIVKQKSYIPAPKKEQLHVSHLGIV
jgi:superfamily II DNA helicase RecQ